MNFQLFIAVGLMSLSAVGVLIVITKRAYGWQSGIAISIAFLVVGAAAIWWLPEWSGLILAGTYVAFVLAPNLLVQAANRQLCSGRMGVAVAYARLAYLLLPVAPLRFNAALVAALANESIEQTVAALRALALRGTPEERAIIEVHIASEQDDWKTVLDLVQRIDQRSWPGVQSFAIRACGELGRVPDMVQIFSQATAQLNGLTLHLCYLFILAFSGRVDSVRLLLGRQLRFLPSKVYWTAIAAKASEPNGEDWRRGMAAFASTTKNETWRRAAERHLGEGPNPWRPALSSASNNTINAIDERWRSRPRLPVPATVMLMVLTLAGLVAATEHGGSESLSTLMALGALSAPRVLEHGEWWRLVSAWFLHYGALHFWVTFYLLLLLGTFCEVTFGPRRMLAVFILGGLASSIAALLTMWSGGAAGTFLVGLTGPLFALAGSEVGRQLLRGPSRQRSRSRGTMSVLRYLFVAVFVIGVLWVDVAIETQQLKIGFAPYMSGFVAGLIIGLCYAKWRVAVS